MSTSVAATASGGIPTPVPSRLASSGSRYCGSASAEAGRTYIPTFAHRPLTEGRGYTRACPTHHQRLVEGPDDTLWCYGCERELRPGEWVVVREGRAVVVLESLPDPKIEGQRRRWRARAAELRSTRAAQQRKRRVAKGSRRDERRRAA